ncbi:hypothetical protein [Zooshikella ganghwensis]|nr:hypothetical protein [Zooshikella ganghwensis]
MIKQNYLFTPHQKVNRKDNKPSYQLMQPKRLQIKRLGWIGR